MTTDSLKITYLPARTARGARSLQRWSVSRTGTAPTPLTTKQAARASKTKAGAPRETNGTTR
jgi:hypothetical protein